MEDPKCHYCGQNSVGMIYLKWVCRLCVDRASREHNPNAHKTHSSCKGG
jgi:hypothetical protein